MARFEISNGNHDSFDALSHWLNRQQQFKHGSDFQLTDHALNLPISVHFDEIDGLNQIDAWGLRVSLVHLSCITQQIVPTDRSVRIMLPLPGADPIELAGRIVYCAECLPGMFHTGVVLDWESLIPRSEIPVKANVSIELARTDT